MHCNSKNFNFISKILVTLSHKFWHMLLHISNFSNFFHQITVYPHELKRVWTLGCKKQPLLLLSKGHSCGNGHFYVVKIGAHVLLTVIIRAWTALRDFGSKTCAISLIYFMFCPVGIYRKYYYMMKCHVWILISLDTTATKYTNVRMLKISHLYFFMK